MVSAQFMPLSYRLADTKHSGQPINGIGTLPDMSPPPRERSEYGQRLLHARLQAKLTQPQLAKAAGMSQGTLAELESKGNSSKFTAQLATACRVRAEWLATGEGPMTDAAVLAPDVADVASAINALPPKQRDWVLRTARDAIEFALETIVINESGVARTNAVSDSEHTETYPKRRKSF